MKHNTQPAKSKLPLKVEYFTIQGFKFPVVLDNPAIQSMYHSTKKKPMLGVVYNHDKGFAAMFCNELFLKLSKTDKKICVLHELGHVCCGHHPHNKPHTINEFLTQEHNADMFAVKFESKAQVLRVLKRLIKIDESNDVLQMRRMLLDDEWEGPLPVLKESKKSAQYHKAHQMDLAACFKMFDAVELGQDE